MRHSRSVGARISRREFLAASAATGALAVTAAAGALTALEGCAPGAGQVRATPQFDLLLKGGMMIDGTGAPGRIADVGIRDGRIAAIGTFAPENAARVIEAKGLCVVPGFIDIHSHVDTSVFTSPLAESKVMQGVTTEASGMDGESPAPLGGPALEEQLAAYRREFDEECPYRTIGEYLDRLEKARPAQNIVTFVGLGTLRGVVVGEDDRPATSGELAAMQRLARESIEQGALGTSTGLEYTPGSYASSEELWKVLSAVPEKYRIYATHMRNEADTLLEAVQEAITIARNAGGRLQISHLKAQNKRNWEKGARAIEMMEEAIRGGLDVHTDRYPYLAFSTGLTSLFPLWCRDGGTEKFLARLRDPMLSARIRVDVERKVEGLSSWEAVMITSTGSMENRKFQGRRVNEIAAEVGAEPYAFTVDLMLREEGRVGMVGFGMDEPGTEMILSWKNTMIASDGGAYSPTASTSSPHPRSYGTFPRALAVYQRERHIVSLPEIIRKMTSLPAAKLGLTDRGTLAPGRAADCVLFDPERVRDRATYAEPHQFPEGIPAVVVNGVPVVAEGRLTGARPGRVIRSS